jgi:tetratricopeptide (TPR) repeat protein
MNKRVPRIYRLDGLEIDTSQVCLKREGREQHLRQQTFKVLVYLLEQRQRVVSKDEIIEEIWPDTAVTDNALEQCLAEIRKALGDDSRNPRFIKTIPRAGYRFIAAVEAVEPNESIAQEPEPTSVSVEPEKASKTSPEKFQLGATKRARLSARRPLMIFAALTLIAIFVFGFYVIRRRSSPSSLSVTLPQAAGKRPVAVMFFDNESSSADLDWLREGLADMIITDLSRSRNLTVLSRQQLHVLLDRLGHKEGEKIRLDEALTIARNSQAKILVLGSFARLGEQMRIDVHLHDAHDGHLLTAERLVVDQPAQILTQVDLLSLKLATYLGGDTGRQEAMVGLTGVMTKNLEAYRYYSLALGKAESMRNEEAITLLQKAIALDPDFAMAHARIGYVYAVTGSSPEKAKPYLEKAYQLPDRLTEKDRIYLTAWYAIANVDFSTAINSFRQIISNYPLEVEAYSRLTRLLRGEERLEEALEVGKQGLVIDAAAKELYNNLGGAYSDLGRHDEAVAMYRRYIELAPEEPNAHDSLGLGLQWAGRYAEAIAAYERALAIKPDFRLATIHLGNTYFQQGRYQDAIREYQHYLNAAVSKDERGRAWHSISVVYARQGKLAKAEQAAKEESRQMANGVAELFMLALAEGDRVTAEKSLQVLESRQLFDRGTRGPLRDALFHRGYFNLKSNRASEAIETFREALKHRPAIWQLDPFEDCLANAFLELGRLDEAIAEYQRILKLNPNYPLVHYHLAQAYERQGSQDQARMEYERFLQVWKDADTDVPEVVHARKTLS